MDWTQIILAVIGSGILSAIVGYATSRHQHALERSKIEQQVGDALWVRTREEIKRLDERADELEAENRALRKEVDDLREKNVELEKEVTSLQLENKTLRQANDALKSELQAAKQRQEDAEVRHVKDVKELLEANASMERELREMRGRVRKVEANTGPLDK